MPRLTDDQFRDDLRARMDGAEISLERVAQEIGLTRSRISQILQKGKPLPVGFYERVMCAMRRIHVRRGEHLGFERQPEMTKDYIT